MKNKEWKPPTLESVLLDVHGSSDAEYLHRRITTKISAIDECDRDAVDERDRALLGSLQSRNSKYTMSPAEILERGKEMVERLLKQNMQPHLIAGEIRKKYPTISPHAIGSLLPASEKTLESHENRKQQGRRLLKKWRNTQPE